MGGFGSGEGIIRVKGEGTELVAEKRQRDERNGVWLATVAWGRGERESV